MTTKRAGMDKLEPELTLKTDANKNASAAAKNATKRLTAKMDDFKSTEVLRESPVQWPEAFPGMEEFMLTSEIPIHIPKVDAKKILKGANMADINQFARLPPDQLLEKINSMRDEIYNLGLREDQEITRGRLLGVFDRERLTKTKKPKN